MKRIPTCGFTQQVAEREVHAVAVVARERERVLVDHAHEARVAALVGALRHPVLVGGREEEHVARLDERAVVVVERVAEDALLDPVGEPARVEAVLELSVPLVVDVGHSEMMRYMRPRVHLTERRAGRGRARARGRFRARAIARRRGRHRGRAHRDRRRCLPRGGRPTAADRRQLRRRGEQHRPRGGGATGHRRLQHAGRPHRRDGGARR